MHLGERRKILNYATIPNTGIIYVNFAMPPWLASHLICELYHAIIFYYVLNLSTILVQSITLPVHQPFDTVMEKSEVETRLQSRQCYLMKRMSCWLQIAPQRRIQRQMTSSIPPPRGACSNLAGLYCSYHAYGVMHCHAICLD